MVRIDTPLLALTLMEKAVNIKGHNFIYKNTEDIPGELNSCKYAHVYDGYAECGCIVGTALYLAGWTLDELATCDMYGAIINVESRYPEMFGEGVMETFQAAQQIQDGFFGVAGRREWGKALQAAREYVEKLG